MAKSYYLPYGDRERLIWLKNFNTKFASYSATFGFTAAEVTSLANDTAAFGFHLEMSELFKTESRERTAYKDRLRDGPIGASLGVLPSVPTLPAPPPVVPAGIFPRVASIVKRFKAHLAYSEAIGQDLGIIGPEPTLDLKGQRPVLIVSKKGKDVVIKYVRGKNDGIQLYCKRGNETDFEMVAVVNLASYADKRPNLVAGQPETRKYRAWFLLDDEVVGQESSEVSIVV